jgi:hypothetical protein
MWSQRDWTLTIVAIWAVLAGALTLVYVARRLVLIGRLANRRVVADGPLPAMLESLRRAAKAPWRGSPLMGEHDFKPRRPRLERNLPSGGRAHRSRTLKNNAACSRTNSRTSRVVIRSGSCLSRIERVFFFQPLNHVARAALQRNAEFLCDDFAATQTGSGLPLAHCLARVAEWMEATPLGVPVAGMAEQRSLLVTRIARLIERRSAPPHASRFVLAVGAVGALVVMTAAAPAVRTLEARTLAEGSKTAAQANAPSMIDESTFAAGALPTGDASKQLAGKDLSGPMAAMISDPLDNHKQDEAMPPSHVPLPIRLFLQSHCRTARCSRIRRWWQRSLNVSRILTPACVGPPHHRWDGSRARKQCRRSSPRPVTEIAKFAWQ